MIHASRMQGDTLESQVKMSMVIMLSYLPAPVFHAHVPPMSLGPKKSPSAQVILWMFLKVL